MISDRADILVKYLYFRALISGFNMPAIETLYRRHILERTGGREPEGIFSTSVKKTADDYVAAATELLQSMRNSGFDDRHPIPVGNNGLLLNGAHRLACALALGLTPRTQLVDQPGLSWDWQWFTEHGFAKTDLLRLLEGAVSLLPMKCIPFVLWAPNVNEWDAITEDIGRHLPIIGHVDLAFPSAETAAFQSLVYDIYSLGVDDYKDGFAHIDRKLGFLNGYPNFMRVGCAMIPLSEEVNFKTASDAVKSMVREKYAGRVGADKFVTIHMADSEEEANHMSATLFNVDNLGWARWRTKARARPALLDWLSNYRSHMKHNNLSPDDCLVVGSGPLEIFDVRQTTDIDFTMRNEIRADRFGPGITHFSGSLDIVTENYHRSNVHRVFTDTQMIENAGLHFRYLGLKFAAPWIVSDRKYFSRRPKDVLDVELIDQHFGAAIAKFSGPWRS